MKKEYTNFIGLILAAVGVLFIFLILNILFVGQFYPNHNIISHIFDLIGIVIFFLGYLLIKNKKLSINMTLKQFNSDWRQFKSDSRKIAIFIILFILSIYSYVTLIYSIYENLDAYLTVLPDLLLLVIIPLDYLLSCLIVWIYDKFRKVKKK